MTQEALKLALEALKNYAWHGEACPQHPTYSKPENYPKCTCGFDKAITAIKEALAEHAMQEVQRLGQEIEQEPVAWVSEDVCKGQYIDGRPRKIWWECEKGVGTAFYTTPPQRTEQNFCPRCGKRTKDIHTCTPPQPEQEACEKMEKNAICSPFMISELWRLSK